MDIAAEHLSLLDRPLFAFLATIRPDGTPQVNPMWFRFDGDRVRFTHTTRRGKFRNLEAHPEMALAVMDPDDPYRYVELRGALEEVVPDPTGAFYVELSHWYGRNETTPPEDAPDRVVLVMRPEKVSGRR